jgi:hypothetical protein
MIQLNRGCASSMPRGFDKYSQRKYVGMTPVAGTTCSISFPGGRKVTFVGWASPLAQMIVPATMTPKKATRLTIRIDRFSLLSDCNDA